MGDAVQGRRRFDGPRRVRNGLKLRRREGAPLPFPADRWTEALLAPIDPARRAEGEVYARSGQVVSVVVLPPEDTASETDGGADAATPWVRIEAAVQGRAPRPYSTVIEVAAWRPAQWGCVIEAMACEAIYAAKLLANEIPPTVEELCLRLGAPLLPAPGEAFRYQCTCDGETPCKHHAAAILLLAERLAENSLLAFNLRGLPGETAMARLQEARDLHTHGRSTAHAGAAARTPTRPFQACLHDFWRPGPQLEEVERADEQEHVPHAILRRLGPSPLHGRFPLVGLLASIYDSVRESARRLREQDESSLANGGAVRDDGATFDAEGGTNGPEGPHVGHA